MQILVLHNNYPAQFKHFLPYLVSKGHEVLFLSLESHGVKIKGVKHAVIKSTKPTNNLPKSHSLYLLEKKVQVAEMFRLALEKLSSTSFSPDVVIFHSGWGLGMHIRTIFKHAKLAAFSEWWFAWESPEIGFDPGSP